MPIYYRSDTRSPEEIFKNGFTPHQDGGENWWLKAIQHEATTGKLGINNKAVDADSKYTVCMSTKFESAVLFPNYDDPKVGDKVFVYAIALPEATKMTYEKEERNLFLTKNLPSPENLENYKNSYLIVFQPRSLNYITPEGKVEKLSYPATEFSLDDDFAGQLGMDELVAGLPRRPGFKQTEPLKSLLTQEELNFVWNEIVRENPSQRRNNNITLITNEMTPTHNEDMVLDFHQLQAIQAKKIVNKSYKAGFFDQKTAAHAGWPLYAYEALAYDVLPQNIICAVQVHRDERVGITIEKNLSHQEDTFSIDRGFTVEGEVVVNPNFEPSQHLDVGRKKDELQTVAMDYSAEQKDALKMLEQAVKERSFETPNIYFGLGGKSF